MILDYDFGEYEVDNAEIAEALAYNFVRKNKNKIQSSRVDSALEYFIKDLIVEGVLDKDYIDEHLDEVKDYWRQEAVYQCENCGGHDDEECYYRSTRI